MNRLIPLTLAVALFMENMDATVISTSLPAIAADIGTTPIALKLAFTAYYVALAIFIPLSAWMADKFGAKDVFRAAIVVFILGSIWCAFAGSLGEFVFARFFKGMGAAMMSPIARLILFRSVEKSELIGAMAWLTIPAMVAPLIGPPIGGFITTYSSWHWVFLINVPIGLAGLVLITKYLPNTPKLADVQPMDFIGFVLLGVCFSGVVFGMSLLSMPILPAWVAWGSTLVGLIALAIYIPYAQRVEKPLIKLDIFQVPTFRKTVIGNSLFLIGVGAIPFLMPLMLQLGFGMSAFDSGMVVFVGAFGAILTKVGAKRLYKRFGFRTALISAIILSSLGFIYYAIATPEMPIVWLMAVLFITGIFRSAFFTGQNALAISDVTNEQAGNATAISTVVRPISNAMAVALAGGVIELSSRNHGGEILLSDFHLAFAVVAGISFLAVIPFFTMKKDAGQNVSGHTAYSRV